MGQNLKISKKKLLSVFEFANSDVRRLLAQNESPKDVSLSDRILLLPILMNASRLDLVAFYIERGASPNVEYQVREAWTTNLLIETILIADPALRSLMIEKLIAHNVDVNYRRDLNHYNFSNLDDIKKAAASRISEDQYARLFSQ